MRRIQPFLLLLFLPQNTVTMSKSTHFLGQPMFGQLINLMSKPEILEFSRESGGERLREALRCLAASGRDALCRHQAFRLFAGNLRHHGSRSPQAVPFGHKDDAPPQHPVRCQRPQAGAGVRARLPQFVRQVQGRAFLGQPRKAGAGMAQTPANHRLHHDNAVLQSHIQGRGAASEVGEEERRAESPHEHPCQRGSPVRHPFHLRRDQRRLHAQALQLCRWRYHRDGQGVCRLLEV